MTVSGASSGWLVTSGQDDPFRAQYPSKTVNSERDHLNSDTARLPAAGFRYESDPLHWLYVWWSLKIRPNSESGTLRILTLLLAPLVSHNQSEWQHSESGLWIITQSDRRIWLPQVRSGCRAFAISANLSHIWLVSFSRFFVNKYLHDGWMLGAADDPSGSVMVNT